MRNVKNTMIQGVLGLVAPHLCFGCAKVGSPLCANCKYNIIAEPYSGCVLCERLTDTGICILHTISYKTIWVVAERKGVLQEVIDAYKFQNLKAAAQSLAELLNETLPLLPKNTLIVPVPTIASHIRERGYDHTLLIAKHFAALRELTLSSVLEAISRTTQHTVGKKERAKQASTAYRATQKLSSTTPYLLIDDIVTTGATIAAASDQLIRAGASTVWVAALARQPLDVEAGIC